MLRGIIRLLTTTALTCSHANALDIHQKYDEFDKSCKENKELCGYAAVMGSSSLLCTMFHDKAISRKTYLRYLNMLLENSVSINHEVRKDLRYRLRQCVDLR